MLAQNPTASRIARRLLGIRQLDHLVRMEPVRDAVLDTGIEQGSLLDVGSGSRGIAPLLPAGWRITSLDSDFEDYGATDSPAASDASRVIGDVRQLPFQDGAFDVVVAVDLLEHVNPADRTRAIAEICRVANRLAVIACPAGEEAAAADARLAERLRSSGRGTPRWLTEHLDNGLPGPEEVEAAVAPFGALTISANESVTAHERLIEAELSPLLGVLLRLATMPLERLLTSRRPRARQLAARLLRNARGNDRPPPYRTMIAVEIGGQAGNQVGRHSSEYSAVSARAGQGRAPQTHR